jgi:NAD(P)-dependent dehydrogenase (short-subunit alcohol dehydrogenase family)
MGDRLGGQDAFVTGAASVVCFATVDLFARRGASLALNHLPGDPREAAAALNSVRRLVRERWVSLRSTHPTRLAYRAYKAIGR